MSDSTALTQAKSGGLTSFMGGRQNNFKRAAQKEGVTDGFYLRMNGKTGEWTSNNPDMKIIEPGTELVFLMYGAVVAWQGFDKDNKLHQGPKVTIESGAELPPHPATPGVKWDRVIRVMTAPTDGGKQMLLTCKANNQYREIWKLVDRYGDQAPKYPDPSSPSGAMSPIVTLGFRSYDMMAKEKKLIPNKVTGVEEIVEVEQKITNAAEVLEIVAWVTQAELDGARASQGEGGDASVGAETNVQLSAPAPTGAASGGAQGGQATTVAQPAPAPTPAAPAPVAALQPVQDAKPASGFKRERIGIRA